MSKWQPKERKPMHVCPKCFEEGNEGYRIPYCGPGDVNYIDYKCKKCGHEWTETD
jgi:C4-type Zn-finger protein